MTQDAEQRQRRAYFRLGDSDLEALTDLRPLFERHADRMVAAFYRHLLSFGPTRELLADPEVKQRLLEKQRAYLLSLTSGSIDAEYLKERRRVGEVHERIGLDSQWYLGAYSLYYALLAPPIWEEFGHDPPRALQLLTALQTRLLFDAQLAMETYVQRRERDLSVLAEELASEGRALARDVEEQRVKLVWSQKRAAAAEQLASIATLVAGLAHEIGTPMNVIQGHAKLLEGAVSGKDAAWRLKTIQEQVGRISKIIQSLLDMARPGRSRRTPVALQPLIETMLSFVSEKLTRRGIEVKRSFEPVPSVSGEAERLQQVFLNLFLNAADAMPEGGSLRIGLSANEDDEVEVTVEDDGVGIPGSNVERIFDPFFTNKEAGHVNGLGLTVVKGIVADHGGTIEVSSVEGRGTRFAIQLPAATGPSGTA